MDYTRKRVIELIKETGRKYSSDYFPLVIPLIFSRKYIGYCGMYKDLEACRGYIQELKAKPSPIVASSLVISLIALYGRCFTDSTKSKFPKLEPSVFGNDEKLLNLHNYMMELRHTFTAHRGESESEMGIALLLIPKKDDSSPIVKFNQIKRGQFHIDELVNIDELVDFLMQATLKKMKNSGNKLVDDMLKNFSREELSTMIIKEE